jgi:hypothetical protein
MRQRLLPVIVTVICLLVLAVAFGGGLALGHFLPPGEGPRINDTATVVTQIQSLAQLVTVKYVFEKVVVLDDAKWYGENRLLMVAHGVAKAGVDFQKLKPDDVHLSGDRVALTLPKPQLMDVYLDEGKTEILERSTGLLRAFDQQMEQDARRQALEAIRKAARAAGILKDAEDRTRQQLVALAHASGFKEVAISFR